MTNLNTENLSSDEVIKLVMPALIKDVKSKAYVQDAAPSDAEVLGLIVSKFNQWDRDSIFETFVEALEDSNFNSDVDTVRELV
jgi:hypothetical protein